MKSSGGPMRSCGGCRERCCIPRFWSAIGQALGPAVAELHAIRFLHFGEWRPDLDDLASPEASTAEWFKGRVEDLKQRIARTSPPLDPTSVALVDNLIADAVLVIGDFEPTYVHGDLGIGNLAGTRTSHGFAFTGVFDLGGGIAGDLDEDLATPIWWPLYWGNAVASRAFLESYRIQRPPRLGQAPRLRAYAIVNMLANWEMGRRQGFNWYGAFCTFRDWALPLLDQVDAIIG